MTSVETNQLAADRLDQHRQKTFRLLETLRLKNREEALRFVEERGFVYFWPIKGIDMPSLWAAVAGDQPVALLAQNCVSLTIDGDSNITAVGVEGFVEFFTEFIERNPVRDIRIIRGLVDGQYVFVQAYQDINNGDARWVTMDLFQQWGATCATTQLG